jgi:hypothetical protein
MSPKGSPATRRLREEVLRRESDLNASMERLGDLFHRATDWKETVRRHPLEWALGAAAFGFLLGSRPGLLKPGTKVLEAAVETATTMLLKQFVTAAFGTPDGQSARRDVQAEDA